MTKAGYAFDGWYKEDTFTNKWDFANNKGGTDALTLWAKWVPLPPSEICKVTFNVNSPAASPQPVDQTVRKGGKIVEPSAMRREGYSFGGWYTNPAGAGVPWNFATDPVTGDMTLYAQWNIIYYTVIFNMAVIDTVPSSKSIIYGGGNQNSGNQLIAFGGKITEPPGMSRDDMEVIDGYGFDGWYWCNDKELFADSSDIIPWDFNDTVGPINATKGTTNINLYPRWIKDEKYLNYTSGGNLTNGNLVWVRSGSFSMGSSDTSIGSPVPRPVHQVTFTKGFYIGMYPVTQEQYQNVIGINPSNFTGSGLTVPVERVTWYDAVNFCNELTDKENAAKGLWLEKVYTIAGITKTGDTITGATVTADFTKNGYRLPTEAEWEYAARGGKGSPGNFSWSGSNTASVVAWYGGSGGNSESRTHPVDDGSKKANILRTFHMSGNVCEWCWVWFGSYPSGPVTDPKGPDTGTQRVRRGGSYNHTAANTRTVIRDSFQPTDSDLTHFWTIGFRIVRSQL